MIENKSLRQNILLPLTIKKKRKILTMFGINKSLANLALWAKI